MFKIKSSPDYSLVQDVGCTPFSYSYCPNSRDIPIEINTNKPKNKQTNKQTHTHTLCRSLCLPGLMECMMAQKTKEWKKPIIPLLQTCPQYPVVFYSTYNEWRSQKITRTSGCFGTWYCRTSPGGGYPGREGEEVPWVSWKRYPRLPVHYGIDR